MGSLRRWIWPALGALAACGSKAPSSAGPDAAVEVAAPDVAAPDVAADAQAHDLGAAMPQHARGHFDVTIELMYDPLPFAEVPAGIFLPEVSYSFALGAAQLQADVSTGAWGEASWVPLMFRAGHWELDRATAELIARRPTLDLRAPPPSPGSELPCSGLAGFSFQTLTLDVKDDVLSGSGTGLASFSHTDYVGTRTFFAKLRGTPDRTPALPPRIGPRASGLNPFDRLVLNFRESLTVFGARLVPEGDPGATGISLDAAPDNGLPSQFATPDKLLPFGARLRAVFDPTLRDAADNVDSTSPPIVISTLADPPVLPADGFENAGPAGPAPATLAAIEGDVALVSAAEVPGISGDRALFVGPGKTPGSSAGGGRFTAKLVTTTSASRLRALVAFAGGEGDVTAAEIRVAAPGGPIVRRSGPTASTGMTPTSLPRFPTRGRFAEITLPLSVDSRTVYLDVMNNVGYSNCGPALPGGLIVDDIRLE
jgi:hypothetical protein